MHYFPSWTEDVVMNMSYHKFMMYLATIPVYDESDEEGDPGPQDNTGKKVTGSFNLFDLDTR